MAQKTVCDKCGEEMSANEAGPFVWQGFEIIMQARKPEGRPPLVADLCPACFAQAADFHDPSPKPKPDLRPIDNLRWLVWLNGVKCPGPHAGFHCETDAEKYLADSPHGGRMVAA